ncbi:MAG: nucleolar 14 family protein, partial [Actinobacteria bacterium]|nr:nucleolar 14 family protein [Actinomycetota bacterium]
EYNCVAGIALAASGESIPLPASCGDCGKSVAEGARKIIAEGFEGAGSKGAFEAAQPADVEDNVASASEVKLDEEAAGIQHTDDAGSSVDSSEDGADSGGAVDDETRTGESGSVEMSGSGEKVSSGSNDDEVAADGDAPSKATKDTSGDAEAASDKGKDTGAGALGTRSVSGKNAAASEEPREVSGPGVLALGAGALLLAAGVIVGRRILRG